jgi:hypothetical protein
LRLPKDDLIKARATLERSFFEKHPEYLPLAALISETDTPTLRAEIELHDELRGKLLKIISALLSEAKAVEPAVAGASSEAAPA